MRFPHGNGQERHAHLVIGRPGLREHEGFLEIQVVDIAILRRDAGAIGDVDPIAMRFDRRVAGQVGALANVQPFADLRKSPDLVLLLAVGKDRVLDKFECGSIGCSVDVDPHAARRTVVMILELSCGGQMTAEESRQGTRFFLRERGRSDKRYN